MRTVNTVRNKPKPSKIQQRVIVNKVQQSGTVTPTSPTTNAVTTHTTRNAHATPIPVKTRPQVTSINTEPRLTPLGRVGLGAYNTASDYANIINSDYEDKSILNQAIGHAFKGNWDKAGQVIQENPYRFAGNLAVEAGAALIPIGMILRGAKIGSTVGKVVSKIKPNKGGGELKEMYAGRRYTLNEITRAEKLIKEQQGPNNKLTQTNIDRMMDSVSETKGVVKEGKIGSFPTTSSKTIKFEEGIFKNMGSFPATSSKTIKFEEGIFKNMGSFSDISSKTIKFEKGIFKNISENIKK